MQFDAGSTGAKFTLNKTCDQAHTVQANDWIANTVAGTDILILTRRTPGRPADQAVETIEAAERALDALSVRGGGHFAIPNPRHSRVLWWPTPEGQQLRITVEHIILAPISIQTRHADLQAPIGNPTARHGAAQRYFRRSQLATDVFAAFMHMYLAFERLLSERVPRSEREGEGKWLRRALGRASEWCEPLASSNLVGAAAVELFMTKVYDVRNSVFHAKAQEDPIVPGPGDDVAGVEEGLRLLTAHVLELLRATAGWQDGGRLLTDHELAETADHLYTPAMGLMVESGETTERQALPPAKPEPNERSGFHSFAVNVKPKPGSQPVSITGVAVEVIPGTLATTELGIGVPLGPDVARVQVDCHIGFRMEGNARTIWCRKP